MVSAAQWIRERGYASFWTSALAKDERTKFVRAWSLLERSDEESLRVAASKARAKAVAAEAKLKAVADARTLVEAAKVRLADYAESFRRLTTRTRDGRGGVE